MRADGVFILPFNQRLDVSVVCTHMLECVHKLLIRVAPLTFFDELNAATLDIDRALRGNVLSLIQMAIDELCFLLFYLRQ